MAGNEECEMKFDPKEEYGFWLQVSPWAWTASVRARVRDRARAKVCLEFPASCWPQWRTWLLRPDPTAWTMTARYGQVIAHFPGTGGDIRGRPLFSERQLIALDRPTKGEPPCSTH